MPLKYPDILQNNNPNYPIADIKEIRGNAYPLGTLSETGSIPPAKRRVGTIVFTSGSQEFYGYYGQTTSSADWNMVSNWRNFSSGSGGSIANTGGFITTGSIGNFQTISGSLTVIGGVTGSLQGTASWAYNSLTASYTPNALITASVTLNTITFTQGNGTQFSITVNTGSGGTGTPTSPGGTNGQIQWNDNGVFNGLTALTWNGTTLIGTGSFTGSFIGNLSGTADTASYVSSSNVYGPNGFNSILTSSYALTASYIAGIGTSYPIILTGSTLYSYDSNRDAGISYPVSTDNNFIMGDQAGISFNGDTINNSIFIGKYTGYDTTGSNENIFLGREAGYRSDTVTSSLFIGTKAGANAYKVTGSTFIGYRAGESTSAPYSVYMGRYSGFLSGISKGSTFIGRNTGRESPFASYSTLIGYNVGSNYNGINLNRDGIGENNIIIGTNITLDEGRRDSINIGGIIFGTGSYFETDALLPYKGVSPGGRIGIGTTNPTTTFEVSGSAQISNHLKLGTIPFPTYASSTGSKLDIIDYIENPTVHPEGFMARSIRSIYGSSSFTNFSPYQYEIVSYARNLELAPGQTYNIASSTWNARKISLGASLGIGVSGSGTSPNTVYNSGYTLNSTNYGILGKIDYWPEFDAGTLPRQYNGQYSVFGTHVDIQAGSGSTIEKLNSYSAGGFKSFVSTSVDTFINYYSTVETESFSTSTINNIYGFYSAPLYRSYATQSYGFYQSGSNDINYFEGRVGIGSGSITPSGSLYVSGGIYFPSLETSSAANSVVLYDSASGQLYYTASSALGSGGNSNAAITAEKLRYNIVSYYYHSSSFIEFGSGSVGNTPTKHAYNPNLDANSSYYTPIQELTNNLSHLYVDILDITNDTEYTKLQFTDTGSLYTFISSSGAVEGRITLYSYRNDTSNLKIAGANQFSTRITEPNTSITSKHGLPLPFSPPDALNTLNSYLTNNFLNDLSYWLGNASEIITQNQIDFYLSARGRFMQFDKYKKRNLSKFYVSGLSYVNPAGDGALGDGNKNKLIATAVMQYRYSNPGRLITDPTDSISMLHASTLYNSGINSEYPIYQPTGANNGGWGLFHIYIFQNTINDGRAIVVEFISIDAATIPFNSKVNVKKIWQDGANYNYFMKKGNLLTKLPAINKYDNPRLSSSQFSEFIELNHASSLFSKRNMMREIFTDIDIIRIYDDGTCDVFEKCLQIVKSTYNSTLMSGHRPVAFYYKLIKK